ncbi:MAG TPA: M48 family metalloprotease [Gaiellaceae bacterium]|nr:M48 family metalloprotease [Gaiellaceae bacterium]
MRVARRRLVAAAALAFLAGIYAVAFVLLWRSSVPGNLRLPSPDVQDYFGAAELEKTRDYQLFVRINFALSQVALLVVLGLYAVLGPRFARESAAGRIGTGMLLGMIGLAFLWLAQLPFGLAQLWWERRHGISHMGYGRWVLENWLGLGGAFLFICLAILIVMALAAPLREWWWLAGAPVFVGLALLFAFLFPYLIPSVHPVRDQAVLAQAEALAAKQGLEDIRVERQDVKELTSAPNAEAVGLGPSRRVILWDTLLDRFADDEVRVVLAHEIAHLSRNHIWKSVAWYALFALPGAYLIARATRRRGGVYAPAAIPLALFVLVVLQLLALPLQYAFTRHLEAEADWVALETAQDPEAAERLFVQLGTTSLSDPSPPTWSYLLMQTHPTLMQRIAMAEAWKIRDSRAAP